VADIDADGKEIRGSDRVGRRDRADSGNLHFGSHLPGREDARIPVERLVGEFESAGAFSCGLHRDGPSGEEGTHPSQRRQVSAPQICGRHRQGSGTVLLFFTWN